VRASNNRITENWHHITKTAAPLNPLETQKKKRHFPQNKYFNGSGKTRFSYGGKRSAIKARQS